MLRNLLYIVGGLLFIVGNIIIWSAEGILQVQAVNATVQLSVVTDPEKTDEVDERQFSRKERKDLGPRGIPQSPGPSKAGRATSASKPSSDEALETLRRIEDSPPAGSVSSAADAAKRYVQTMPVTQ